MPDIIRQTSKTKVYESQNWDIIRKLGHIRRILILAIVFVGIQISKRF